MNEFNELRKGPWDGPFMIFPDMVEDLIRKFIGPASQRPVPDAMVPSYLKALGDLPAKATFEAIGNLVATRAEPWLISPGEARRKVLTELGLMPPTVDQALDLIANLRPSRPNLLSLHPTVVAAMGIALPGCRTLMVWQRDRNSFAIAEFRKSYGNLLEAYVDEDLAPGALGDAREAAVNRLLAIEDAAEVERSRAAELGQPGEPGRRPAVLRRAGAARSEEGCGHRFAAEPG